MLRRFSSLVLVVAALAAFSPAAQAQVSFSPPKKAQEDMEKDKIPAIFYFIIPGEITAQSFDAQFFNQQVAKLAKDLDIKVVKISVVDSKSSRPWGTYQKLADEFGVGLTTTIAAVSYDRYVMDLLSSPIRRDDLMVKMKNWKSKSDKRIKEAEACDVDCEQIEKWIGEKKYGDAARRMKMVLEKADDDRMPVKSIEKAKALDEKVKKIGEERLAEGKALLDAGKGAEAKPILEEVAGAFARYDCAKEAKELLKKIK